MHAWQPLTLVEPWDDPWDLPHPGACYVRFYLGKHDTHVTDTHDMLVYSPQTHTTYMSQTHTWNPSLLTRDTHMTQMSQTHAWHMSQTHAQHTCLLTAHREPMTNQHRLNLMSISFLLLWQNRQHIKRLSLGLWLWRVRKHDGGAKEWQQEHLRVLVI